MVALLLAGCQSEIGASDPESLDMPPGKTDRADPEPEPLPGDPDTEPCAQQDCTPDAVPAVEGVEREPNDDASTAMVIGVPVLVVQGELDSGDHDWFQVRIVQRGGYVFETSTGDLDDDRATDTLLRVYAAEVPSEPIASDDDSGEGFGSRAAITLNPGSFLVEILGYGAAVTGPYTLEVRGPQEIEEPEPDPGPAPLLPPAELDESEANDTIDNADSMGEDPDSIGAELEPAGVDHFAFAVSLAGTVTIETGPRVEGGSIVDTVVELYDLDGTLLGSDDDGADEPLFSRLTIDLPAAGVYVLKVRGYSASSSGSYRAFFVR